MLRVERHPLERREVAGRGRHEPPEQEEEKSCLLSFKGCQPTDLKNCVNDFCTNTLERVVVTAGAMMGESMARVFFD